MKSLHALTVVVALITTTGFTETLMAAQDHAVNSDVVLESVVEEVKAIPQDIRDIVENAAAQLAGLPASGTGGH